MGTPLTPDHFSLVQQALAQLTSPGPGVGEGFGWMDAVPGADAPAPQPTMPTAPVQGNPAPPADDWWSGESPPPVPEYEAPALEQVPQPGFAQSALMSVLSSIPMFMPERGPTDRLGRPGKYPSGFDRFAGVAGPLLARGVAGGIEGGLKARQATVNAKNAAATNEARMKYQSEALGYRSKVNAAATIKAAGMRTDRPASDKSLVTMDVIQMANDKGIRVPATALNKPISDYPELAGLYPKTPPKILSGMNELYAQTDPDAIADQIYRGLHPPVVSMYGRPVQGAIASSLATRHPDFNLTKTGYKYAADLQLYKTASQNRMVILKQTIGTTRAHLERLSELNDDLDRLGVKRGTVPEVNRVALGAAVRMGGEAGKTASQFSAQVALLESELASVFSNGAAPTDDARRTARRMINDALASRQISGNIVNIFRDLTFKEAAMDKAFEERGLGSGPVGEGVGGAKTETWTKDPQTGKPVLVSK
jgi:hypothetical protein